MSDMQITVRLRWKSGLDVIINTFCKILIYLLLNKVFRNHFFFILFHFSSSMSVIPILHYHTILHPFRKGGKYSEKPGFL